MRALLTSITILLGVAPAIAQEKPKAEPKTFQVPYRLSDTKHILVRAKINGKGPFHFILDTGAPVLFVAPKVCRKLDVEPDKNGWGVLDRLELEGGLTLTKAKGRIEEPPQLGGMNSLGLAGAELHGVLGYNLLAKYRIEIDFTRTKMAWTEQTDFAPPAPAGLGESGRSAPAELNAAGGMAKLLGGMLGKTVKPEVRPRGFLGADVDDGGGGVSVTTVLDRGPAARAGLKAGDKVTHVNGAKVAKASELRKALADVAAGQVVTLTIARAERAQEIAVTAGEGL